MLTLSHMDKDLKIFDVLPSLKKSHLFFFFVPELLVPGLLCQWVQNYAHFLFYQIRGVWSYVEVLDPLGDEFHPR